MMAFLKPSLTPGALVTIVKLRLPRLHLISLSIIVRSRPASQNFSQKHFLSLINTCFSSDLYSQDFLKFTTARNAVFSTQGSTQFNWPLRELMKEESLVIHPSTHFSCSTNVEQSPLNLVVFCFLAWTFAFSSKSSPLRP